MDYIRSIWRKRVSTFAGHRLAPTQSNAEPRLDRPPDNSFSADYIAFDMESEDEEQSDEKADVETSFLVSAEGSFDSDYIPCDTPENEEQRDEYEECDEHTEKISASTIPTGTLQFDGSSDYIALVVTVDEAAADTIDNSGYISLSEDAKSQIEASTVARTSKTNGAEEIASCNRRQVLHTMRCDNCNHIGHRWMQCIDSCVLCDSSEHRSPECDKVSRKKDNINKRKAEEVAEPDRTKKRARMSTEVAGNDKCELKKNRKGENFQGAGAEKEDIREQDLDAERGSSSPDHEFRAHDPRFNKKNRKRSAENDDNGESEEPKKRARRSNENGGSNISARRSGERKSRYYITANTEKQIRERYSYRAYSNYNHAGYSNYNPKSQSLAYNFGINEKSRGENAEDDWAKKRDRMFDDGAGDNAYSGWSGEGKPPRFISADTEKNIPDGNRRPKHPGYKYSACNTNFKGLYCDPRYGYSAYDTTGKSPYNISAETEKIRESVRNAGYGRSNFYYRYPAYGTVLDKANKTKNLEDGGEAGTQKKGCYESNEAEAGSSGSAGLSRRRHDQLNWETLKKRVREWNSGVCDGGNDPNLPYEYVDLT